MNEYSYFRAEGRSLQAAKTAREALVATTWLKIKLSWHFKAIGFESGSAGDVFIFAPDKVPAGFVIEQIKEKEIIAAARPGTKEAFFIASIVGLLKKEEKKADAGALMQCPALPEKKLPPGIYSNAFVRRKTVIDANKLPWQRRFDEGSLPDGIKTATSSSLEVSVPQKIATQQLGEAWYIRVPNDENGQPLFVPPDAVALEYGQMLQAERDVTWGKNSPPPSSGGPGMPCG